LRDPLCFDTERWFAQIVRDECHSFSLADGVEPGEVRREKLVNELGDASATLALGNEGGTFLDRWQGIRDRYRQSADAKEGKVVLGIADPDAIER
jgi:hypothetical protein